MALGSSTLDRPQEGHQGFLDLQKDIETYYGRCHGAYQRLLAENQQLALEGKSWEVGRTKKEQALNASTNELFQLLEEMRKHRTVFEGMDDVRKRYQDAVRLAVDAKAI